MASLAKHLTADSHDRLAFRSDCPLCRAQRAAGPPLGGSPLRRLASVLVAGTVGSGALFAPAAGADTPPVSDPGAVDFEGGDWGPPADVDPADDGDVGDEGGEEGASAPAPPAAAPPSESAPTTPPGPAAPTLAPNTAAAPSPPSEAAPTSPAPAAPLPAPTPNAAAPAAPPPAPTPAPNAAAPAAPPPAPTPAPNAAAPAEPRASEVVSRQTITAAPRPRPRPDVPKRDVVDVETVAAPPRAAGHEAVASREEATGRAGYRVQPGDSLWAIARARLGPGPTDAAIAREVDRLWRLNAGLIATGDPDLLPVGTWLRLK